MLWLCTFFNGAGATEPEPMCIIEIEKRKSILYKMSFVPAYFFTEPEPDWVSEGR